MNVREHLADRIYNLCEESLNNIPQEEWDQLHNNIREYLESQNIQEEVENFQEAFNIKPDEKEELMKCINEAFDTYPLVETFFDNRRDFNLPPMNMMKVLYDWCRDFVQQVEDLDPEEREERIQEEFEEFEEFEEISNNEEEEIDEDIIDTEDYITVKYFQGLFLAIYEMFMNREL